MRKYTILILVLLFISLAQAQWEGVGGPYPSKGGGSVSDTVYGAGWNGVTTTAPSKNAVYDKIETLGASGAPTDADYLVGTANGSLSAEIVAGTAPGGELGGTWGTPTVDATHSGSAHHSAVSVSGTPDYITLSGQDIVRAKLDISDDTNLVAGAGLSLSTNTLATDSSEANFLLSGALTCGAGTAGKAQVHTTPFQYCDNAATPALQYAAYGDSSGNATGLACTGCVSATDAGTDSTGADELNIADAESEIEGAIDTLANLVSVQALTVTLSDAAANAIFGWDDTAGAYENLTAAEALAVLEATINILLETEIDASSELLAIMDDETGTGLLTFATNPLFTAARFGNGATTGGYFDVVEDTDNGTNRIRFTAPTAITSDQECIFENDGNPIPDSCVGDGTDDTGAGSGDNVTVNSSAADTTANLTDGDIDFTLVDGGAGGPDNVTATVACSGCVDATDNGTDSVSADELNATGVETELEAALDIGGEVMGTGMSTTVIADSVAVSSWNLTTPTFTTTALLAGILQDNDDMVFEADANSDGTNKFSFTDGAAAEVASILESGVVNTLIGLDGIGAIDLDYGSADITDHAFITDGTGDSEIVLPDDSIGAAEMAIAAYDLGTSVEADTLTEGGNAVYNSTEVPGGSLGGTWASPTIDDLFLLNSGDAGVGDYDFGVGTQSFEIPNSATVTDPNVAGEIAIDTTTDQFLYYGGAQRVLHYEFLNCGALRDATTVGVANDYPIFTAPADGTIVAVSCQATGTSAQVDFEDDADTNVEADIACDVSSPGTWDESIAGTATFVKGEGIEFDVDASSAATSLTACVRWVRTAD